jgi:hypothetical protein
MKWSNQKKDFWLMIEIKNHGNQPWFQSSIKKRTVIETVVIVI